MDSMLQVSANTFSKYYGPKDRKGGVASTSLKFTYPDSFVIGPLTKDLSEAEVIKGLRRHLVLVLDVSGSMDPSMEFLRAAILTIRDLLGKVASNTHLTVIVYNSVAAKIWPVETKEGEESPSLDSVVKRLSARSTTDIGAGLQLAFNEVKKVNDVALTPAWIILMSDGDANHGNYRTERQFSTLANTFKDKNPLTSIKSIGYGTNFNSSNLKAIGEYTHINTKEDIPAVMGCIVYDILRTVAMNLEFSPVECPTQAQSNEGDLISAAVAKPRRKCICGKLTRREIINGTNYFYGCMPHGDTVDVAFKLLVGTTTTVKFMDMSGKTHKISVPFKDGGESVSIAFLNEYFKDARDRTFEMYLAGATSDAIATRLRSWPDSADELKMYIKEGEILDDADALIQEIKGYKSLILEKTRKSDDDTTKTNLYVMDAMASGSAYMQRESSELGGITSLARQTSTAYGVNYDSIYPDPLPVSQPTPVDSSSVDVIYLHLPVTRTASQVPPNMLPIVPLSRSPAEPLRMEASSGLSLPIDKLFRQTAFVGMSPLSIHLGEYTEGVGSRNYDSDAIYASVASK